MNMAGWDTWTNDFPAISLAHLVLQLHGGSLCSQEWACKVEDNADSWLQIAAFMTWNMLHFVCFQCLVGTVLQARRWDHRVHQGSSSEHPAFSANRLNTAFHAHLAALYSTSISGICWSSSLTTPSVASSYLLFSCLRQLYLKLVPLAGSRCSEHELVQWLPVCKTCGYHPSWFFLRCFLNIFIQAFVLTLRISRDGFPVAVCRSSASLQI